MLKHVNRDSFQFSLCNMFSTTLTAIYILEPVASKGAFSTQVD